MLYSKCSENNIDGLVVVLCKIHTDSSIDLLIFFLNIKHRVVAR